MKPAEFRAMSDEHLNLTLRETVKNLFHLRFQSATERLETPSEIRKARQDVARIKTVQREAQLIEEMLGRLPENEASRIRALPREQQLTAARSAIKRATKEK